MPMIRYRLEDRCMWLAHTCPCGSSFPLIGPPQGRSWDMIRLPTGQMVSPLALNLFLRELEGIDQFRVIQERPDHLVVQLASQKAISAAAVARLESQIRGYLREPMRVDIQRVGYQREDTIKFKTFVSKLHEAEPGARRNS
jgi:phenylacetate-CoA ligase